MASIPVTVTTSDKPWNNFCVQPAVSKNYNITGCVWKDMNGNGLIDSGEQFTSGIQLNLLGSQPASTSTMSNGCYAFTQLPPGDYQVQLTFSNNYLDQYKLSPSNQGSDTTKNSKGVPLSPDLASATVKITTSSVPNVNFGVTPQTCPLVGEVSQNPCGNNSPVEVEFYPGNNNEFCIYVKAAPTVTVSQLDYVTIKGINAYGAVSSGVVTDEFGGDASSNCWTENYGGSGNVCAKQNACQGFDSRNNNCEPNDVNFCMHCDSNSYMMLPARVCFTVNCQRTLTMDDFVGASVKVGARGINGYCAYKAQVEAVLCEQTC